MKASELLSQLTCIHRGITPKIASVHTESEAKAKATVQQGARKAAAENLCDLEPAEFCFDTTWVLGFRHFYPQGGSGLNHNISSCYAPWHKKAWTLCGWCQVSSKHHFKNEWTSWGFSDFSHYAGFYLVQHSHTHIYNTCYLWIKNSITWRLSQVCRMQLHPETSRCTENEDMAGVILC